MCAQDEWLGADLKGGFFGIRYADYEDSGRNIALSATLSMRAEHGKARLGTFIGTLILMLPHLSVLG